MPEIHEERSVVTDDRPGLVASDPVRRGNPAPVIAAICIALLLVFLVFFGMSRTGNDNNDTNDGPRITLPQNDDDGGSSDTGSKTDTDTGTSPKTETSTKTSTP